MGRAARTPGLQKVRPGLLDAKYKQRQSEAGSNDKACAVVRSSRRRGSAPAAALRGVSELTSRRNARTGTGLSFAVVKRKTGEALVSCGCCRSSSLSDPGHFEIPLTLVLLVPVPGSRTVLNQMGFSDCVV